MRLNAAKAIVHALGLSLNRTTAGDLRLAFRPLPGQSWKDTEPSAYYTQDLSDAVATAQAMHAIALVHGRGGKPNPT